MPPVMKLTECATVSLLVHTTVVPALTVSAAGPNLKLTMPTSAVAAAPAAAPGAGAAAGGVAVAGDVESAALAPHAARATVPTAASAAILRIGCRGFGIDAELARA